MYPYRHVSMYTYAMLTGRHVQPIGLYTRLGYDLYLYNVYSVFQNVLCKCVLHLLTIFWLTKLFSRVSSYVFYSNTSKQSAGNGNHQSIRLQKCTHSTANNWSKVAIFPSGYLPISNNLCCYANHRFQNTMKNLFPFPTNYSTFSISRT